MERETRFELATFALARQRSTTEPFPQSGGNNRARTYDPLLVRQMLSQLSYASKPELLVYNTKFKKNLQLFLRGFSKKIKYFFIRVKPRFIRYFFGELPRTNRVVRKAVLRAKAITTLRAKDSCM